MKLISFRTAITLVVITSILSIPTYNVVFRVDDWDYINELNTLSFIGFIFKPNPAGQFNPVFKAIYGALLLFFQYNNVGVALFNYGIGIATFIFWILILRHLNKLTLSSVLFLCCIRLSYVGLPEVLLCPQNGGIELAFFCLTFSFYLLLVYNTTTAVMGATLLLIAGAFSWANGILIAVVMPPAYWFFTKSKSNTLILLITWLVVGISILIPKPSESLELPTIVEFVRYFFASAVINGLLGGLTPNTLPGIVHAIFFVLLIGFSIYSVILNKDWQFRFLVCSLFLIQLGINFAVSITRAHHGVAHAGSYRYVFMNVFLQLLVLSLIASKIKVYVPLLLVLLAIPFGIKARLDLANWEKARTECLNKIINSEPTECLSTIYYRDDPQFIIETYKFISK